MAMGVVGCLIMMGCDDSSNDVGVEGFDRGSSTGSLHVDTLDVGDLTDHLSFMDSVSTGNANTLYLGSVDNMDFRILLRFTIPSTLDDATILAAKIEMVPRKYYGSAGSFPVTMHSIQRNWTTSQMFWNRFQAGADYGDVISQATLTAADAGGSRFEIAVPADTVQNWIRAVSDTNYTNYGLLMDFDPSAAFVQQFYSAYVLNSSGVPDSSFAVRLRLTFQREGSSEIEVRDIAPITFSGFSGGFQGFLYRDRSPQDPTTLTIGGGLPYHSLMRFSTVKIPSSATVNRADLVALRDPAGDYRFATGDTAFVQSAQLGTAPAEWTPGETLLLTLLGQTSAGGDTVRLSVTSLFQAWAAGNADNNGLILYNGSQFSRPGDFSKLYRIRLRLDPNDPNVSPKIVVYYTLPPQIQDE